MTLQKAALGIAQAIVSYMLHLPHTPQSLGPHTPVCIGVGLAQGLITCCFPSWHTQPGNAPHLKEVDVTRTYDLSCVKHAQGVW